MSEKAPMTAVEKLMLEANNEVNEELLEKYKGLIKDKLRAKANAEKVVRNIEAEIIDLQMKIEHELA